MTTPLKTRLDPRYGSRRLEQSASSEDVHAYFEKQYYSAVSSGQKGVDIKRSLEGGEEAQRQRDWMASTLYADIAWLIEENAPGKRVLDAGCGTGDLLSDLAGRGFEVSGAELAPEAAETSRAKGHAVIQGPFEDYPDDARFDAILFMHVLSHAADPQRMLEHARSLLNPGGIVLIRSGNDFNAMQTVLSQQMGHGDYWVTADHQHYFGFESANALMKAAGFEPVYQQSDFPMEMIALMGDDFVGDPELGKMAHEKRVTFETQMPTETRRRLYQALAAAGLGRCILVAGRVA